jgi:hypothetical protein
MHCTPTATDSKADSRSGFDDSRFDPRDRRAALRDVALRLARESSALPEDVRWSYLRGLRTAARLDQPLSVVVLPSSPSPAGPPFDDALVDPIGNRRVAAFGLRRFALTGVIAGLAAALALPASLSESLPWTSGNDRGATVPPVRREGTGKRQSEQSDAVAAVPSMRAGRAERNAVAGASTGRRLRIGGGAVSGTGSRDFGTLRVDRPVLLRWSAGGRPFAIRSKEWSLRARERGGTTVLTPGAYRRFAVKSSGRWTLRLVAP